MCEITDFVECREKDSRSHPLVDDDLRPEAGVAVSQLDLTADFYVPHTAEIADRTQQALSAIEQCGVGRAMIRAFGLELVCRYSPLTARRCSLTYRPTFLSPTMIARKSRG